MISLTKTVLVDAPADRVFAYVTEPTTMAEWLVSMVETRDVIGAGEGQQYEWTYKMVGLHLRGQTTVVEHVPNELSVHQSIGAIGSTWTFGIEPHEEGSSLTVEVEYSIPVPVLGKLAERIAEKRNARELEQSLTNVQEMLAR
jgi:uncharacterized protein YndB with AHSA1/START domain